MSSTAVRVFCAECNREVQMLTSRQAAELLETSQPQLEELIAAGKVHAIRIASRSLQVCKDSLYMEWRRREL